MKKKILLGIFTIVIGTSMVACGSTKNKEASKNDTQVESKKDDFNDKVEDALELGEKMGNVEKFVKDLKPTHQKTIDYPLEICDRNDFWLPGYDIKDISHLTNAYYSFRSTYAYEQSEDYVEGGNKNLTWEQISRMKVSYLENEEFSIYAKETDYDFPIVSIEISDEALELGLTVGKAIDQGYYIYYYDTYDTFKWEDFFTTEPKDEEQELNYVNEIIAVWGQPTEVYYSSSSFDLLYETENNKIFLYGYYFDNYKAPQLSTVYVYGNNYDIEEGMLADNKLE